MYILDSDVVIWILRGEERIISKLDQFVGKDQTGISAITVAEVYKFAFPSEFATIVDFIDRQVIIPVTLEIAKESGLYWNQFHKQLLNLSISDCLVAASVKAYKAILLTLNTRHFPMSDIKVRNPLK